MRQTGNAPVPCIRVLDEPVEASRGRRAGAVTLAVLLHAGIVLGVMTLSVRVLSRSGKAPMGWMEVSLPPPPPAVAPEAPEPPVEPAEPSVSPRIAKSTPEKVSAPEPQPAAEPEPPPPAAAEAGKVLDAGAEVVDFGDTIVTGAGRYRGGVTESGGLSKVAVRDVRARATGVPGGTGTGAAPLPPPKDLSRPPKLAGRAIWDCPFPGEADAEEVNSAVVSLRVQVGKNGAVESVDVTRDPGFGFGREARRCALRKKWQPGLDRSGQATGGVAIVNVSFGR